MYLKMKTEIQFILELVNFCNFRCKYCYLSQANNISPYENKIMSKETGSHIISYIKKNIYEKFDRIFIDFLDGEPLLNFSVLKHIVIEGEKVDKLNKFIFRFTTNGSLLTNEIIDFANLHKIYFNISFDGIPSAHDKNRIIKNTGTSSSIVLEKINLIKNFEFIGVVSTFTSDTYEVMSKGIEYLAKIGFKHIEANIAMGNTSTYTDINKLRSVIEESLIFFTARYQQHDFSCNYVILDRILKKIFSEKHQAQECIYPYQITYDGSIKFCDRIPNALNEKIANVFDEDFDEFYKTKKHICKKGNLYICEKCDIRAFCTPCNAYIQNYYTAQSDIYTEPVFCTVMKAIISVALSFYSKNKNNLIINMHFNTEMHNRILQGKYTIQNG